MVAGHIVATAAHRNSDSLSSCRAGFSGMSEGGKKLLALFLCVAPRERGLNSCCFVQSIDDRLETCGVSLAVG